jgi:hypothetical protein
LCFPLQNNHMECGRNGNTFIECSNYEKDDCSSNGYLQCYLSDILSVCETKEMCEQAGIGYCSDSEYFVNYETSPPTIGSCVVPFQVELTDNGIRNYCYQNTIPLSVG